MTPLRIGIAISICCLVAATVEEKVIKRSVILVGPTGVGKSAVGNHLTNRHNKRLNARLNQTSFVSNSSSESVTKNVSMIQAVVKYFMGDPSAPKKEEKQMSISVRDSAGLGDTEGLSMKMLDDIVNSIKADPPHGIIYVLDGQVKQSQDLEWSLKAFGQCLGAVAEDLRRNAVFVNKLPAFKSLAENDGIGAMYGEEDEEFDLTAVSMHRFEVVQAQLNMVNKYLGLPPQSYLETVIGNEYDNWTEGMSALTRFITNMPEEPMKTENLRTFTEVATDAKQVLVQKGDETKETTRQIQREASELEARLANLKAKQDEYDHYLSFAGGAAAAAGGAYGAWQVAATTSFIPGLNFLTTGAALLASGAAAGVIVAGAALETEVQSWSLPEKIEYAAKQLRDFNAMSKVEQAEETFKKASAIWDNLKTISRLARGKDEVLNQLFDYEPKL